MASVARTTNPPRRAATGFRSKHTGGDRRLVSRTKPYRKQQQPNGDARRLKIDREQLQTFVGVKQGPGAGGTKGPGNAHGPDGRHSTRSKRVAMTFFPNQYAKTMEVEALTLQELANLIVTKTARQKGKLPWLKLATFNGAVNPANPEAGCLRCDVNVVEISGIEGDKDDGPLGFDEAGDKLEAAGLRALLYTSASHTEEKPRFRVVCPTSRQLPPAERKKLMARLNGVLGGALSPESFTLSQSYYFGHVKGTPVPHVRVIDGDHCIDQRADLDKFAVGKSSKPNKIDAVDDDDVGDDDDDNPYSTYGKWVEANVHEPIDVDQALAEMWHQDGHGNIRNTQLSVIAALLCRGVTADEAIAAVLERTMEVSKETRATQIKRLRGMVESWLRKHPELNATAYAKKANKEPLKFIAEAYDFPPEETLELYDWLSGRHLLRGQVCGTAAGGGTGKSSKAIVDALAMASGQQLLHDTVPHRPLRVVLINLEDDRNTMAKRIAAAMKHHHLKPEDIGDRLIVFAKGEIKFKIAKQSKSGEVQRSEEVITALADLMIEKQADVLSIDSFIRTHQVNENDNPAIEQVIECFEEICTRANCCVHLWHHTRKGKGDGGAATVESSRGAMAFIDGCRSVRILETMSEKQADHYGISKNYRQYFRSFSGKRNFAPHIDDSDWFYIESVALNNGPPNYPIDGDSIGVVEIWEPPSVEITPEMIEQIREMLASGQWRESVQAAMWAGKGIAPIVNLDPDSDRAQIKALISDLIRDGVLMTVTGKDEKRKDKLFIVPGKVKVEPVTGTPSKGQDNEKAGQNERKVRRY